MIIPSTVPTTANIGKTGLALYMQPWAKIPDIHCLTATVLDDAFPAAIPHATFTARTAMCPRTPITPLYSKQNNINTYRDQLHSKKKSRQSVPDMLQIIGSKFVCNKPVTPI